MRTKKVVAAVVAAALVVSTLALVGCGGSKKKGITGEWKMENSEATYVITDKAITAPNGEIPYKIGKDGAITLFAGEAQETEAKYTLSDDGKTLTIIESMEVGGEEEGEASDPIEITTVFTKVSDNKDAKPSNGASDNGAADNATDDKADDKKDDK